MKLSLGEHETAVETLAYGSCFQISTAFLFSQTSTRFTRTLWKLGRKVLYLSNSIFFSLLFSHEITFSISKMYKKIEHIPRTVFLTIVWICFKILVSRTGCSRRPVYARLVKFPTSRQNKLWNICCRFKKWISGQNDFKLVCSLFSFVSVLW